MKNQEINNQTTLFRFVSLRSAELTKKENQDKRFIFHPNPSGTFFNAVENKDSSQTKWNAMRSASENFSAFQNEKEIEEINPDFFQVADWVSRNKSTLDPKELAEKMNGLQPLDLKFELNLWDNLFYQVLTQKSFYVKEAVIQLLVMNNILKNKSAFIGKTFDAETAKQLVLAKVVLPIELFEETATSPAQNTTSKKRASKEERELAGFVPQELLEAKEVAEAKIATENAEFLLSELKRIEQSHCETYEEAYNRELKAYQEQIKPTVVEYQKRYKEAQRRLCEKPKDEHYDPNDICNQPDIEYPELPEFVFNFSQEPEIKSLQEHLSEDSFAELSSQVDLKKVKSFSELKQSLENNLRDTHQKIVDKTQISEQVLAFGDTAIALKGNTLQTNDFTFQICTTRMANGNVSPYMTIQLPNSNYTVQQFIYHLHYNTGGNNTSGYFNQSLNGNVLTLSNMYNNTLPFSTNSIVTGISGYIIFTNGQTYTFDVEPFSLMGCYNGKLVIKGGTDTGGGDTTDENSFIPNTFGYRQLGIADYKKVVSKICKYEVGEVAHIENVMARELREKITKKFHQTQVIETESNEIETEKLTDTSTTERFEMQTEVAKLMQEQKQFAAHVDVHSSWGNTTIDAGASYASNVSKEESNRQAVNQAKEITQRAMERIVSRVKNEKTVKTTDEFTEENNHRFDNTESGEHVSGVFRFINAIYKNQIYNYGKRLMYEFMIPQPSKLHRLGMAVSQSNVNAITLDKPTDPRINYPSFTSINENNYQLLASKYNAEVKQFPTQEIYIGQSFEHYTTAQATGAAKSGNIKIPDGYYSEQANASITGMDAGTAWDRKILVTVGDVVFESVPMRIDNKPFKVIKKYREAVPVSISITNFFTANITVNVLCKISLEEIEKWRKETFDAIMKGYEAQLEKYNEALSQAQASGIQILDSNPLFYRQIEQNVLRENCISYLLDHTNLNSVKKFGLKMYNDNASFTNFQVNLDKKMDDYGSFIKFMEQAFEWNLMSYNFYPYYWANKDEWKDLYQFESNDAIFRSFMQAGMARVIVTVKPGFEEAVMHYLTTGQIWLGGQMPVLGNPLYLSIVDELKEQEYTVEETWTTTLPTQLIALQKSGVSVDATGLPTLDTCETQSTKKLVANDAKLGIGTAESDTKLAERVAKIESRMIENIDINDGTIKLTTKGKNRQTVAEISVEDLKRELK